MSEFEVHFRLPSAAFPCDFELRSNLSSSSTFSASPQDPTFLSIKANPVSVYISLMLSREGVSRILGLKELWKGMDSLES